MMIPLVALHAQGLGANRGLASSAAGSHMIKGRVFFPDDRPAGTRVKVRLESANTFGGLSAVTDEDGQFMFRGLEAGPYTVIVEGDKAYETAREAVAIDREASPGGRIIDIPIYLKLKSTHPMFAGVPPSALDNYNKAQVASRAGDGKKAIEHLKDAVAIYPNFSQAYNELGVQYLKLGQVNEASEALSTAVKLAPAAFQPRLNFGIALLNQKKFPESELQLRAAIEKAPKAPIAHMYLGMALMNQKKLEDAQGELEQAVRSNSSEVAVAHKYLGGIYWGMRDYKRAADELETYLKLVPKAADAERTRAAVKDLRSKQ
jgi:tetratricopeptide (TPR) repeat protein